MRPPAPLLLLLLLLLLGPRVWFSSQLWIRLSLRRENRIRLSFARLPQILLRMLPSLWHQLRFRFRFRLRLRAQTRLRFGLRPQGQRDGASGRPETFASILETKFVHV